MKRIGLILLTVSLMIAAVLTFSSCGTFSGQIEYAKISEGNLSSEGFTYDLYENNTAEITGCSASGCFLTIPETVDGYKVISIGKNAFANKTEIVQLKVPEGVQVIGDSAFEGCTALVRAELPKSLLSIGYMSFATCNALWEVTGHEKLELIGGSAFYACTSLSSIDLPKSLRSIGNDAFSGCSALAQIVLPENECTLGNKVFSYCDSLSYVELGGITCIPEGTFEKCTSLSSINIGKKIESIGNSAFRGCEALRNVTVSNKLKSIGYSVFEETPWLSESTEEFLVIGDGILVMYNGNASNVEIPKNVKIIADAFCANETMTTLVIGNKVKEIGAYAFLGCTKLTKVTISADVTVIGESAFSGCGFLSILYLPDSLELIDKSAFRSCVRLSGINYAGSQKKWSQIVVGEGNNALVLGTVNYNSKP